MGAVERKRCNEPSREMSGLAGGAVFGVSVRGLIFLARVARTRLHPVLSLQPQATGHPLHSPSQFANHSDGHGFS